MNIPKEETTQKIRKYVHTMFHPFGEVHSMFCYKSNFCEVVV